MKIYLSNNELEILTQSTIRPLSVIFVVGSRDFDFGTATVSGFAAAAGAEDDADAIFSSLTSRNFDAKDFSVMSCSCAASMPANLPFYYFQTFPTPTFLSCQPSHFLFVLSHHFGCFRCDHVQCERATLGRIGGRLPGDDQFGYFTTG
jgi:hypothetical protein